AARVGIKAVGEASFAAGAFVAEREWGLPRGQSRGNAGNVFGGLFLHADQGVTFGFCLDRADGSSVHEERVVGFTGDEGKLTDRYPARGREVDLVLGLNRPAGRGEHRVDLFAGQFFRGHLVSQPGSHRSPRAVLGNGKTFTEAPHKYFRAAAQNARFPTGWGCPDELLAPPRTDLVNGGGRMCSLTF